jgi:hypothetical protein
MKYLALLIALFFAEASYGSKPADHLVAPPPGTTLPVSLTKTLRPLHLVAGQPISAHFIQRVPVSAVLYLPPKVEVIGHIVSSSSSLISILFTQLRWKNETVPIHVQLVSAGSVYEVLQASMPLGATDRSTSSPANWTTRQIGGDEVYRSAGSGKLYDQYSQPVGFADLNGVYQDPSSAGEPPHAMGPFSTTAAGLYGLEGFSIVSAGGAGVPITLAVSKPKWQIGSDTALLLKVVP